MGTKKGAAMKLRLRGYSYNEIHRTLQIPKSTLSGWFHNLVLSDAANRRLAARARIGTHVLIARNKMQTHRARQRAENTKRGAANEIESFGKQELRLIGAVLYWAEGYKRLKVRDGKEITSHTISFVNADPDMIRAFIRFTHEILLVPPEDVRASMRLYEHISEEVALRYWMGVTELPQRSFRKTTWMVSAASKSKRPFNRLPFGTVQISVQRTEKFYQLMGWIEGVKKQLSCDIVAPRLGSSVVERPPESSGLFAETRIAKRVNSGDTQPQFEKTGAGQSRAKPGTFEKSDGKV